jgi:hypothetical protein
MILHVQFTFSRRLQLSRAELDARKASDDYSEAANPLEHLAQLFNNYDGFSPQNVMVQHISLNANSHDLLKRHLMLQAHLSGVTWHLLCMRWIHAIGVAEV